MEKRFHLSARLLLLLVTGAVIPAQAEQWPHCRVHSIISLPTLPRAINPADPQTYLYSDEVDAQANDRYDLTGHVAIQQENLWLEADNATFWRSTQEVQARGAVRLGDLGMAASGGESFYNLNTKRGYLLNGSFNLKDQHGHGESPSVVIEGPGLVTLHDATYSTCDPDDRHWRLHASSIRLDRNTGFGSAASSYLTVYDVPVMFFPYFSFPINDARKSGFLVPGWGNSSVNGATYRIPYYLNLAPNYDATITGVNMSRRGFMVQTQARYLTPMGQGQFTGELLQSDDVYGADRYYTSYSHSGKLNRRWRERVDISHVSDKDYFYDFGNALSRAATNQLNEEFTMDYAYGVTSASASVQGYYTVDRSVPTSERPYFKLPSFNVATSVPLPQRALRLDVPAEYVNFYQEDRISGHRIDFTPTLSAPFERSAGFIIPSLTLFQTNYELSDNKNGEVPASQDRTLPAFSVDSGLFFEREFLFGERAFLHTIEPRLFYVNIPYKDQSDIPVFNTAETSFSFGQLFRVNRFAGPDRVGDANQLTVALSSRFLDDQNGATLASVSLGQLFYNRDRVVQIDNSPADTESQSDIIAEFLVTPIERLTMGGDFVWNSSTDMIDKGTFQAQLNFGQGRIINAAYRYNREQILEQDDYSFAWPLGTRWKAFGRWNYSHPDDLALESMGGLAYDSCCWALRLLHHRFYRADDHDYNESIMVELELKGLGGIGDPIESMVGSNVPGFTGF